MVVPSFFHIQIPWWPLCRAFFQVPHWCARAAALGMCALGAAVHLQKPCTLSSCTPTAAARLRCAHSLPLPQHQWGPRQPYIMVAPPFFRRKTGVCANYVVKYGILLKVVKKVKNSRTWKPFLVIETDKGCGASNHSKHWSKSNYRATPHKKRKLSHLF